MHEAWMVMSLY